MGEVQSQLDLEGAFFERESCRCSAQGYAGREEGQEGAAFVGLKVPP